MNWNDAWREELKRDYENVFLRLCECNNVISDISIMTMLMYKYNSENHSAEECLDRMIDWVVGWNNQVLYIDFKEYQRMLNKVLTNFYEGWEVIEYGLE